jgi:LysM repeat protein
MTRILLCALIVMATAGTVPVSAWSQDQPAQAPAQPKEPTPAAEQAAEPKASGPGQVIVPKEGTDGGPEGATAAEPQKAELSPEGIYTIKQGDTLWDISNTFLKDPFLWPLLWKANPYIKNPDLIYPGNKLVIPNLAPIEHAIEQPEETVGKETAVEEKPSAVVARPKRPAPKQAETPEEAPKRPKLVLPEEAPTPIIDRYAMINAGFVNEEESDDRIIGSLEPKTIFGYDDVVYVSIESRDDVQVGERFLIYRPMKNVKHPRNGDDYGRLIRPLGILQITSVKPGEPITARITLSFDAIEKDSLLTPYQEPALVFQPAVKREKDLAGYILEVVDGRTINAQIDIVYIDKGEEDGVEPGDRFSVFGQPEEADMPKKLIGEVQVFLVKKATATAVVRKSTEALARGDEITYAK